VRISILQCTCQIFFPALKIPAIASIPRIPDPFLSCAETVTKCHGLKRMAAYGKIKLSDITDTKQYIASRNRL